MSDRKHHTEIEEEDNWISKSELKRQVNELQGIGEELLGLSASDLAKIPLDEELADAITLAHKIRNKKEAYRRQLQFIGKVMRGIDPAPIVEALDLVKNRNKAGDAVVKQLETLRSDLLSRGDAAIQELLAEHPHADRQKLRQLVRQANKEQQQEKPAKAAKELFKYLKEVTND